MKGNFLAAIFFTTSLLVNAQDYQPTQENLKQRQWFEAQRFGIMIHWGLYSLMAGGGENAPAEWIMRRKNIAPKDYEKLMTFFNPGKFSAEQWVKTCKNAGAGYLNFVVKHGDGFLLYDSETTDFKVTNTPYSRDILREIKNACEQHNLGLILHYYMMDLHSEDYRKVKEAAADSLIRWQRYLTEQNVQIEELVTKYGKLDGIWFNGWWDLQDRVPWNLEKTYQLIHQHQPQILITNNHHRDLKPGEDYELFYKEFPTDTAHNLPRETFYSISNSWGYNLVDEQFTPAKEIIRSIVKAASLNSNYTLNIGPAPDGTIPPPVEKILNEVGEWMKIFGATIYGTMAGPFYLPDLVVSTQKKDVIYLHFLESHPSGEIVLGQVDAKPDAIHYFDSKNQIKFNIKKGKLTLQPDQEITAGTVVALVLKP